MHGPTEGSFGSRDFYRKNEGNKNVGKKDEQVFGSKESDRPFPLEYCSDNEISRENKHPLKALVFASFACARGSRTCVGEQASGDSL